MYISCHCANSTSVIDQMQLACNLFCECLFANSIYEEMYFGGIFLNIIIIIMIQLEFLFDL